MENGFKETSVEIDSTPILVGKSSEPFLFLCGDQSESTEDESYEYTEDDDSPPCYD